MTNKECSYCYKRKTCIGFGWYDKSCRDDKESCSIRKCSCKDNNDEVIEDASKSE